MKKTTDTVQNLRNLERAVDTIADSTLRRYMSTEIAIIFRKLKQQDTSRYEKESLELWRELNS